MANLYNEKGEIDKAIETTERAHSISKEIKDKEKEVLSLNNLTSFYIKKGNFFKALQYAEDFLEIANELSSKSHKANALSKFSDIYSKLGNYKKAHEYLLQYITVNDSMFNENITHQIAEMQTKYETEKKEKEIEIKNLQIREEQTQVSKQKTQKYAFIGGFAMMLILAVVVFKSYRQKKKDNKLLAQKNVEIEEKNEELNQSNEEIAAQRDEIEAQRDLVTKQKEELELIHSELKDSIYYAERIQKAVLPGEQYIQSKIKGDFFILFKPKDIVSGDFYFIEQRKHWLLIAVADCTGHGVPGAFMSMLGISFLNEIIAKEEIQTASHVLDELRQYVIHSLQQKGVSGEQKDGMDIAFVAINLNPQTSQVSPGAELSKTCEVCTAQYAGANNPLYIVTSPKNQEPSPKNQELPTAAANCQLLEIKGDKMPVAIHENMQPFTNHVIELQKGDTIYLMSDGYADQFGGSKGKKFYEKQLKEMLSVNCNLSMAEQKEILDKTIEGWKNGHNEKYEQTDDITILGIKI
ncbi:MAG: SpoIIE family protein phosphatase [Bacteroidia bacterium]|nr:SpoIIE family protein phosphatase [Bacteroidia bacterium]